MKAKQYTIRNVPRLVDQVLRQKAAARGTSMNELLLGALAREAGVGAKAAVHSDLDALIGSWVADPAVDEALREQRKVNPDDWK